MGVSSLGKILALLLVLWSEIPAVAGEIDSPLGRAIRADDRSAVSMLLASGASPEESIAEGQRPLHLAIALRRAEIVAILLRHSASPHAKLDPAHHDSFLPLLQDDLLRWLLRHDRDITPLMLAAGSGDTEIALALMNAGACSDASTPCHRITPLSIAARSDDVKMMRRLLGKDPLLEERRILVDLSGQKLRVFDSSGLELLNADVSTGKKGFATPVGTFAITHKHREWHSSYTAVRMPFFQRLSCGDLGLHQGIVTGKKESRGCIRLHPADARQLFALTEPGDRVEIQP
ncbi:MAG: hypothetical protein EAZ84_05650 [Verrucomicrobia bacterium]|nr:MAG: hypothetical protein EAZ84_05650 [Verrucomicrobiota bacterium]TAE86956.1 MAG: hypothetical protein EAZ82_09410 [Verrucomicrobiota bacterium]TAF24747.1 MAG: hypothetical protein EAZ71_09635 [Verrucomicrobiota bacterium]